MEVDFEEFESAKEFIATHFGITHQQSVFLIAIFIICNDTDLIRSAVHVLYGVSAYRVSEIQSIS